MSEASFDADLLIVGSGPAGTLAAFDAVAAGISVLMIDYGLAPEPAFAGIPARPFSELRRSDANQAEYFLGPHGEGKVKDRIGGHLTPPRKFAIQGADELLPYRSKTFFPLQSLARGGLGTAWGTACFTYSDRELQRIGLDPSALRAAYDQTAADVGVSGPVDSDPEKRWWSGVGRSQKPLEIDSNAEALLRVYGKRRRHHCDRGFFLGRMPLAVLSEPLGRRGANPYFDMDFYSNPRDSAFRPQVMIEDLLAKPNFRCIGGSLAVRFEEFPDGARIFCREGGKVVRYRARRLLLAAGAINTGRIVLNSVASGVRRTTVLTNVSSYIPTLNLAMFGRDARDRRHSFAQLHAIVSDPKSPEDALSVHVHSYRSLLMFRLARELPVFPWLGVQMLRSTVNALTIFGSFAADAQSEGKFMEIASVSEDAPPLLSFDYRSSPEEIATRKRLESILLRRVLGLGCVPLARFLPGNGGSIHYAGTVPFHNPINPRISTTPDFRLADFRNVFIGDSSSWNWLPNTGLTFTGMAAARVAVQKALGTL